MSLTDPEIRAAKPADKPYKLSDERGLYLLVKPNSPAMAFARSRPDPLESEFVYDTCAAQTVFACNVKTLARQPARRLAHAPPTSHSAPNRLFDPVYIAALSKKTVADDTLNRLSNAQ